MIPRQAVEDNCPAASEAPEDLVGQAALARGAGRMVLEVRVPAALVTETMAVAAAEEGPAVKAADLVARADSADRAAAPAVPVVVPVGRVADRALALAVLEVVRAAALVGSAPAIRRTAQVREVVVANRRHIRKSPRPGLTLLELILALALSVLVMMAIGMAIDIHYRMFDVRRTSIEETHVARAVLRSIADDLRTAVQYIPPDLSGLETVTGNTAAAVASAASNAVGDLAGAGGG